eukprot:scaffold1034_cov127-Cylindrotheca_fusiformis.AAC.25
MVPKIYGLIFLLFRADAFAPAINLPQTSVGTPTTTRRQALWRHWVPETDAWGDESDLQSSDEGSSSLVEFAKPMFLTSLMVAILAIAPTAVTAVSGGGLDFAGIDISGKDFSNQNYKGKDFTQVLAKGTNFAKSNLQGCRFYKAYLVNTDFTDADIRGVSMEDTSMDGASLKNAIASGSYFSTSILDTKSVENADFTDAQFPVKVLPLLCDRADLKGTNPVTGVDTRESVMCP